MDPRLFLFFIASAVHGAAARDLFVSSGAINSTVVHDSTAHQGQGSASDEASLKSIHTPSGTRVTISTAESDNKSWSESVIASLPSLATSVLQASRNESTAPSQARVTRSSDNISRSSTFTQASVSARTSQIPGSLGTSLSSNEARTNIARNSSSIDAGRTIQSASTTSTQVRSSSTSNVSEHSRTSTELLLWESGPSSTSGSTNSSTDSASSRLSTAESSRSSGGLPTVASILESSGHSSDGSSVAVIVNSTAVAVGSTTARSAKVISSSTEPPEPATGPTRSQMIASSTERPSDTTTSELSTAISSTTDTPDAIDLVTSTLGVVPSGVSFQTLSSFSGNSWTTTTDDSSSSTIIPIIAGVAVWHLPTLPSVKFNLPNLPSFRLPSCIIGSCPDPPKVDKEQDDEGGDEGEKGDNNDDDDDENESEKHSSTSTAEATTEEGTSSTSACSGAMTTVSDCRVACSTSYDIAGNSASHTQVCYTTSCERTSGCSLQPTTTTSTATSVSACAMGMSAEFYNPVASWSAMGLEIPPWMDFPLSFDYVTAVPTMSNDTSIISTTSNTITDTFTSATMEETSTSSTHDATSSERESSTGSSSAQLTTSQASSTVSRSMTTLSSSTTADVPSTTISSTTNPTPVCHEEADFPGHAAIDASAVQEGTQKFCSKHSWDGIYAYLTTNMTSESEPVREAYRPASQVNYLYEVEWKGGSTCKFTAEVQQIGDPLGGKDWDCTRLFNDAYSQCNNGGVGGYLDAGCLRYTFTGGLGNDEVPEVGIGRSDGNNRIVLTEETAP